jgi:hypothetical protein
MPVRRLPDSPNLDHLKAQAKDLRRDHAARSAMAAQRLREFYPRFRLFADEAIFSATLSQSDALLAVAREYGYPSWPRLKARVEGPSQVDRWSRPQQEWITDPTFRRAVDLIDAGDAPALRNLLQNHPALVHQQVTFEGGNYFHSATLLNFIAENPVRNGKLPANIREIASIVLDAGPDQDSKNETLMLVATGAIPREYGVQRELIALLCAHGAEPNAAAKAAAVLMEPASVEELLKHGAVMTPILAPALGLPLEGVQEATPEDLQVALSVAAQYGRSELIRDLLKAGANPNQYNPPGGHSHATPLHQAACFGHVEAARTLIENGARLDTRDILWNATPLEWAKHEQKDEVAHYLETVAREM